MTSPVVGLIDRLGGVERVRDLLDRFYARLFDDPMVGFFFAGHERRTIVDGQLQFLRWATGDLDELEGRHPREAHAGLAPILRGHFDRRLKVLRETLETEALEHEDVEAWLRIEESMRRLVQSASPSS